MPLTAREVFAETVLGLPPNEQLHLATLILQELARSKNAVMDQSDTWSEQDQKDLTIASLEYAATLYPKEEDLV